MKRTAPLPPTFMRLAWSNLAAQSAEQIGLAAAPYLSDLDFSAFRGDDPPDNQGVAMPALQIIMTSARDRLADVGEIAARGVQRPRGLDRSSGSMTSWRGLQAAYCGARTLRLLQRVTEQRIERYGPSDGAWRTEYAARVKEHELLRRA